jgi:hypothetical protein
MIFEKTVETIRTGSEMLATWDEAIYTLKMTHEIAKEINRKWLSIVD